MVVGCWLLVVGIPLKIPIPTPASDHLLGGSNGGNGAPMGEMGENHLGVLCFFSLSALSWFFRCKAVWVVSLVLLTEELCNISSSKSCDHGFSEAQSRLAQAQTTTPQNRPRVGCTCSPRRPSGCSPRQPPRLVSRQLTAIPPTCLRYGSTSE